MLANTTNTQQASTQAYPRRFRLTSQQDFSRVFKKNTTCRDQYFRILAQTGTGLGFARLGQVVSRKVDRRAVQRNRIKRLVRESFRRYGVVIMQQDLNTDKQGIDFVVLAQRQAAMEPDNRVLFNSLNQLWDQLERKICRH